MENNKIGKKINVGCGKNLFPQSEGWDNLDSHNKNGANIIFNLEKIINGEHIPFKNNYFDEVYCSHVIEDFINPIPIIDELIRLTKPDGIITIKVPNDTIVWNSIYHTRGFTPYAFKNYVNSENYGISKKNLVRIVRLRLNPIMGKGFFAKIYFFCGHYFFRILPLTIIQNTFLKYLYPNSEIEVVFKKKIAS